MQERDVWFDPKSHVWALWVDTTSHHHTSNKEAPQEVHTNRLQQILPTWLCTKLGIVEHTRDKTSFLPISALNTRPYVQSPPQAVPNFTNSTPISTHVSQNSNAFTNSTTSFPNTTPNVRNSTTKFTTSDVGSLAKRQTPFEISARYKREEVYTTKFTTSDVGRLTKSQTPFETSARNKREDVYTTRDDAPKDRLLYAHTRGKAMTFNQVNLRNMSQGSFLARTKEFGWLHDFARSSRVLCSAKVWYSRPPVIQECKVVGWVVDYTSTHVEVACNHTFFVVPANDVEGIDLAIHDQVTFELRREDNRFVPCNIARLVVKPS